MLVAAAAKSLQSCPTLCDPRDGSPPGSPIPGILQARTLDWVAISFSSESEVAQSHLTLRDPMDCSLPGSSVHGIFQARVLEWGAVAFYFYTKKKSCKSLLLEDKIDPFPSIRVAFQLFLLVSSLPSPFSLPFFYPKHRTVI